MRDSNSKRQAPRVLFNLCTFWHACPDSFLSILAKVPSNKALAKLVAQSSTQKMSNSEIQAWISAGANTVEDDFDIDSSSADPLNSWAGTESDWSALMELARRSLLTSKTKDRVDFLNNKLLVLVTRGGEWVVVIYCTFPLSYRPQILTCKMHWKYSVS